MREEKSRKGGERRGKRGKMERERETVREKGRVKSGSKVKAREQGKLCQRRRQKMEKSGKIATAARVVLQLK